MAAHEHINKDQSGKYVRLHRGFGGVQHNEVDTSNLGVHWVGDDDAGWADHFAGLNDDVVGTVLTGLVHKRHIMEPGSEEHEEWSNTGEGSYEAENEVPLRPGTPVHIIGAYDTNYNSNVVKEHKFTPRIRGRA
jgi:hypothetical protein